jgi:hypothetical protein
MSHADNRANAVIAFDDPVNKSDQPGHEGMLEMLGVAQYHAATANYELSLEILARLEVVGQ